MSEEGADAAVRLPRLRYVLSEDLAGCCERKDEGPSMSRVEHAGTRVDGEAEEEKGRQNNERRTRVFERRIE